MVATTVMIFPKNQLTEKLPGGGVTTLGGETAISGGGTLDTGGGTTCRLNLTIGSTFLAAAERQLSDVV